jgi:hypothetical protein
MVDVYCDHVKELCGSFGGKLNTELVPVEKVGSGAARDGAVHTERTIAVVFTLRVRES